MGIAGMGWRGVAGAFVLMAASIAAAERVDLGSILQAYDNADNATERSAAVARLADCEDNRALTALAVIAERDSDESVRSDALAVIGVREEKRTDGVLLEFLERGGTRGARRAAAKALAGRAGTLELLKERLESRRADLPTKLRLVSALASFPSLDAYAELDAYVRGDNAALRSAALRAIARHEIGKIEFGDTLVDVLSTRGDPETVLTAFDLIEDHAIHRWPEIEPLVAQHDDDAVEAGAEALREHAKYVESLEIEKQRTADGYGVREDERPPQPTPRSRLDIVYAFDATGSTVGQIEQVQAWVVEHASPLAMVRSDIRVGVIAYRSRRKERTTARAEILPLTHDMNAVEAFVLGIEPRGADSQGAAIADAVGEALDGMQWRDNARCSVLVMTDGRVDDPKRANRIARQHRAADRTQLSVWYQPRTRPNIPESLEKLAEAGGGTFTNSDERRR